MSAERQELLGELNKFRNQARALQECLKKLSPELRRALADQARMDLSVRTTTSPPTGTELEEAIDIVLGKIGCYEIYLQEERG